MNRLLAKLVLTMAMGVVFVAPAVAETLNLNAIFGAAKNIGQSASLSNMSDADEVSVGRDITTSMFGRYALAGEDKLQRYLNQVGLWVALQSGRASLPWRFALVESPEINAFAVPGGTILVTRGMMQMVANEAELACVLGHEVAHVEHKHHLAVLQKTLLVQAGAEALSAREDNEIHKRLLSEGSTLFNRALDRGAERQADEVGIMLAARAGYDPGVCLSFMQRMASLKAGSNALESLYKTHPTAEERKGDVENALRRLQGASAGEGERPPLLVKVAESAKGKKR